MEGVEGNMEGIEKSKGFSYKDVAMGFKGKSRMTGDEEGDDGDISDDDVIEESTDPSWFGIVMT